MALALGLALALPFGQGGGGYVFTNAEAAALVARFTTPPTNARKQVIDTLVGDLKAATIWTNLDLLYLTAAADAQAAQRNWIADAFNLSPVNSPTFVSDRGYTGDGASSRLNTGWAPSPNGVRFTQNDASMWVWSLTSAQSANIDIGNNATVPNGRLTLRDATDNANLRLNDAATDGRPSTDGSGMFGGQRRGAADKRVWKNGTQVGTAPTTASTGLPTDVQWMCGANNAGFSVRQQAFGAWGSGLSGLESAFFTAVQKYMQAVGAA